MKSIITSLIFIAGLKADQPIKCPKIGGNVDYIDGVWTFVTTKDDKVNLYQTNGHHISHHEASPTIMSLIINHHQSPSVIINHHEL